MCNIANSIMNFAPYGTMAVVGTWEEEHFFIPEAKYIYHK